MSHFTRWRLLRQTPSRHDDRSKRVGATVAPARVRVFLLNENHAGNKGRAKFFSPFGFDAARWEILCDALLVHVAANQVAEIETTRHGTNEHGALFSDFP